MFWALFVASILMFIRNRAAVFFTFFLPLIIMLIFGVLNFEGSVSFQVGVADEAQNAASQRLADGLAEYDYIELSSGSRDELLGDLEDGDVDFVLVVPEGFEIPQPGQETGLVAYTGSGDPAQAQVSTGLFQQAVAQALFAPPGAPPGQGFGTPPLSFESVESRDLGYIDFLVPGVLGMTVMQLGLFSVAFGFVQLKRTGALRRLFATPTSPAYFLSAQVSSRLIIALVQVAILLGVGLAFGLQMFGDYLSLALIVMLAAIIFLAMGFAVAGWAKNEDQAAPVANLLSLPMMFLSGVFFPREAMPEFLRGITQYMPLTYANEALRAIVNEGAALTSLGGQLLGMAVWAVIAFLIAVRLFRWE
jgi:ABC-2 type transport system permease protein